MAIRTRRLRNGKTAYDVELRRPDGTKYSKTFHAKRDAQAWEAEQRVDRARDGWIDPTAGRVPLRTYADEWLRTRRLAPRTQEVYASQLKHIVATFGDTPLNAITRRAVRVWHADLSARVSPLQAAKCYRLLMAFLNTAAEDDLIAKNRCRVRGAALEESDERPLIPVSDASLSCRPSSRRTAPYYFLRRRAGCASANCSGSHVATWTSCTDASS